MKNFIEKLLSGTVAESGEGAIGRGLEEIKAIKEVKPGIVAKGRG